MEAKVVEFLKSNPRKAFSSLEVARTLDMPHNTTMSILQNLVKKHRIASRKANDKIDYFIYVSIQTYNLRTDEDIETFSYDCPKGFSGHDVESCKRCPVRIEEFDVKRALLLSLSENNWIVEQIAWGGQPGADVLAKHEKLGKLVIEAKGEGNRYQMRRNYFHMVMGEMLQRMDVQKKRYGIGLPAFKQFTNMAITTPEWIKEQLNLNLFLVKRLTGRYGYVVGHRSWGEVWDFVERK